MTDVASLDELLACPRCDRTPLARDGSAYSCGGCRTAFPSVGGLPWLFAEPDASRGEWQNRLRFSLQRLAHDARRLRAELRKDGLAEPTKRRLELKLAATDEHRQALQELLAPLDLQALAASYESHLALRTRLPADQGLNTYYANVHRDWCWGERENEASLEQLRRGLASSGDRTTGDTLVLGAGACRLAYDLHGEPGAARTVALDFNPLLLLIARDVVRGESLALWEFPLAPRTLEDVAVKRTLRAPAPAREDFHLVLGDVLRAPFAAGAFDTVVTPWLIDIVSEDFPVFAARINRLLKPGGRWLNFGSLAFDHPEQRRCYSSEEVLSMAGEAGFATPAAQEADIPYMSSPASRNARVETVFTFCARKEADVKAPPRHRALPDWIVTGREAVPLLPSFRSQAVSTQIYSFVMSLIDGRRSIEDMAKLMEKQKLMTRSEAVPAIRRFLTKMYDDSQRQAGF